MSSSGLWRDIKQHPGAFVVSVVLHLVLFVLLGVNLVSSEVPRQPAAKKETVKAVIVDASQVEREYEKLKRAEESRQQQQQKLKREAEQARKEAEQEKKRLAELKKKQQAEQQRLAELKKKKEQEEKERKKLEAERKKQEEERKRLEAERKKQEEKERLAKEAEQRRQAEEAELKRKLAEEERREQEARDEAERQDMLKSLRAQYVKLIEQKVERNWLRPGTVKEGQTCEVYVTQTVLGDVINVVLQECAGDPVFQRSVERAVRKASPLPPPPSPDVFDREIHFTFRPSS